jgi:hypothetical protein
MGARSVNDIETDELATFFCEIDLMRLTDHVIDDNVVGALESDVHNVVFGVVNDPNQWQPLCLDLVPESKGSDLDLGMHALELFRQEVQERLPLSFI